MVLTYENLSKMGLFCHYPFIVLLYITVVSVYMDRLPKHYFDLAQKNLLRFSIKW